MENNFHIHDEFEQFLQDEVKQHRMYPSEHVWENIRTELHGTGSWKALTFIAIFIIVALTATTIYNYPPKNILIKPLAPIGNVQMIDANTPDNSNIHADANKNSLLEQTINPTAITNKTINKLHHINKPQHNTYYAVVNTSNNITAGNEIIVSSRHFNKGIQNISIISKHINGNGEPVELMNTESIKNNTYPSGNTTYYSGNNSLILYPNFAWLDQKNKISGFNNVLNKSAYNTSKNLLKTTAKIPRFSYQLYITPSISYRNLVDNQERLNDATLLSTFALNSPVNNTNNLINGNINAAVHHKPAIGMEAGGAILYRLNKNLQIKTGLQFNVRRYYIDAYWSPYNIATIAYVRNHQLDSVNMLSSYSNAGGFQSAKLDNKLYQISIPIGVQWSFFPDKKIGVDAGISFQPTLTLNKNVYLLSTDYKYYTNGAPFFRKWNANTGIELNVTYKTANRTWFIGPQVRYQHFPTYNDLYPIKEFRWDYGLKIGFTQPIR